MKRIAWLLALLSFSNLVSAAPNIIGEWKSDAQLSTRFNAAHGGLDGRKTALLSQLAGHLTMTFTAETVSFDLPAFEVTGPDGKQRSLPANHEAREYHVLEATENTVTAESINQSSGEKNVDVFTFDGPDVFWIPLTSEPKSSGHSQLREYFVRVTSSTTAPDQRLSSQLRYDAPQAAITAGRNLQ